MSSPDDAPYQLIIMDCQMPEMDGYEATKAIRTGKTKERYNDIPIIAMTANAMKGDKEKCLIAGMNDYATKPVDSDVLHEKLLYWIGEDSHALEQENYETNISKQDFSEETASLPANAHANHQQINNKSDDSEKAENEAPDLSPVVWDKVGFLKRVRNNEAMAKKLSEMFVEDMPEVKEELCAAIMNKELDDITSFAHKLTGTASNLGGISLAKLTKSVENNAIDENVDEIELLVQQIEKEYQLFHDEIYKFSVS
jgi:CheY-like chemotaxis protein